MPRSVTLIVLVLLVAIVATVYCACPLTAVNVARTDSSSTYIAPSDIQAFIGLTPTWVDPASVYWACSFARSLNAQISTPGGDSGEFLVGLSLYQSQLGQTLTQSDVNTLFQQWIVSIPTSRGWYYHTDSATLANIRTAMHMPSLNLSTAGQTLNSTQQAQLLSMLIQPSYIGCAHTRAMLQNPTQYQVPANITQWYIQAFYNYMWTTTQGPSVLRNVIELETSTAEDQAIVTLNLDTSRTILVDPCRSNRAPLLLPTQDDMSVFFYHKAFANQSLRRTIASFFVTLLKSRNINAAIDPYVAQMDALVSSQFMATVNQVIPNLPRFNATLVLRGPASTVPVEEGAPAYSMVLTFGSLAALVVMLILMIIYGIYDYKNKKVVFI